MADGEPSTSTVTLALVAAPGPTGELARKLSADLPALLRERVSTQHDRSIPVVVDQLATEPASGGTGMIDATCERMLRAELAAGNRRVVPEDDDVDVRFVAAVVRGHLRLLAGMLRANRPWRLIARCRGRSRPPSARSRSRSSRRPERRTEAESDV